MSIVLAVYRAIVIQSIGGARKPILFAVLTAGVGRPGKIAGAALSEMEKNYMTY